MFHVERAKRILPKEKGRGNVPCGTLPLYLGEKSRAFGNGDHKTRKGFAFFAGAFDGNSASIHGGDCLVDAVIKEPGVFDINSRLKF